VSEALGLNVVEKLWVRDCDTRMLAVGVWVLVYAKVWETLAEWE